MLRQRLPKYLALSQTFHTRLFTFSALTESVITLHPYWNIYSQESSGAFEVEMIFRINECIESKAYKGDEITKGPIKYRILLNIIILLLRSIIE